MEIILLDNVNKLGKIGEIVKVKDGYGRNYLIPNKLAMQATNENKAIYEQKKKELEEVNKKKIAEAKKNLALFNNKYFTILRQAGEDGRLFGSVSLKDIADALTLANKINIAKSQIFSSQSIKYIDIYKMEVNLYGDISANIFINVARNEEEAKEAKANHLKADEKEEKLPPKEAEIIKQSSQPESLEE